MLVYSLKIPGHMWLDPIFVSLSGLCQATANVYKSMKGKKNFYKLTIEDIHNIKKDENDISTQKGKKHTLLVTEKELQVTKHSMPNRERLLSNIAEDFIST